MTTEELRKLSIEDHIKYVAEVIAHVQRKIEDRKQSIDATQKSVDARNERFKK